MYSRKLNKKDVFPRSVQTTLHFPHLLDTSRLVIRLKFCTRIMRCVVSFLCVTGSIHYTMKAGKFENNTGVCLYSLSFELIKSTTTVECRTRFPFEEGKLLFQKQLYVYLSSNSSRSFVNAGRGSNKVCFTPGYLISIVL